MLFVKRICWSLVFALCTLVSFPDISRASFTDWLQEFKVQAVTEGITSATIDTALADVEFLSWVIDADRRQPEFKKSLNDYLAGAVTPKRVKQARRMLAKNRPMLTKIAQKYRVQAHYLVALWGVESNFGRNTGKVPILSALATLAYDARRSHYFRQELLTVLRLLDSGTLKKNQLFGSWAGAMGQLQFMPSTFAGYAVDENADGKIDLWRTPEDYLASAANYLQKSGWQWRYRWGRKVVLPTGFEVESASMDLPQPLSEWRQLGLQLTNGANLPKANIEAALVIPDEKTTAAFLVYRNYRVLMRWNKAHSFALAVGLLADRIIAE